MANIKRESVENAVRSLVSEPEGRCFLQWLLRQCDVRGPVFCGDMESVCRRESRRDLGRDVEKLITASYSRKKIVEIEEEEHGQ